MQKTSQSTRIQQGLNCLEVHDSNWIRILFPTSSNHETDQPLEFFKNHVFLLREKGQTSNSSGKKSASLVGPFRSLIWSSNCLGRTSSIPWPEREKYLSSTICNPKNGQKKVITCQNLMGTFSYFCCDKWLSRGSIGVSMHKKGEKTVRLALPFK